jgi:hypothetical protein
MAIEIKELKQMLKNSTAVLILDNGDPSFVVVDYDSYRRMLQNDEHNSPVSPVSSAKSQSGEMELLDRINKDILALKEQIEEEEKALNI